MVDFGASIERWAEELGQSGLAGKLVEALGPTVLSGIVAQLNANGLGPKVNSWLGRGANEPLTPDELRQAMGNQKLQEIAKQLGVPADKLNDILAKSLPAAVDHASRNGVLGPGLESGASASS